MNKSSTIVLRGTVIFIGAIFLALCLYALPRLILAELDDDFDYGPIFLGLYVPAVPLFYALYQTLKLLTYVDKNQAFSTQTVRALRNIKLCGFIISGLFVVGMPYIFYVADRDDAPGLAAIGFIIIGASFVIGTTAAVLQKLIQSAVDIKSENDLTV